MQPLLSTSWTSQAWTTSLLTLRCGMPLDKLYYAVVS